MLQVQIVIEFYSRLRNFSYLLHFFPNQGFNVNIISVSDADMHFKQLLTSDWKNPGKLCIVLDSNMLFKGNYGFV